MKFSHTVQFNAVPEWQQYYIAYSSLKKIIYQVEKDLFSRSSPSGEVPEYDEVSALLGATNKANELFLPALTEELKRIVAFYCKKEVDLYTQLEKILHQAHVYKARSAPGPSRYVDPTLANDEGGFSAENKSRKELEASEGALIEDYSDSKNKKETPKSHGVPGPSAKGSSLNSAKSRVGGDDEFLLGNREKSQLSSAAIDMFVHLSELKNYVTLNYTGFSKILKKYDKVTGSSLSRQYLGLTVQKSYPYQEATKEKLDAQIQRAHELYAGLRGMNKADAFEELKDHLREHLVWERNTVWKDMISLERKANAVELKAVAFDPLSGGLDRNAQGSASKIAGQLITSYYKPLLTFGACFIAFILLLVYAPFEDPEPNGCLALLVFASLLWATEVIPLFVTALLVPFLVVVLGVLKSEDGSRRLSAPDATHQVFASMFSPVIMLLLGGFSLASALSKHHIAKKLASMVLSYAGNEPSRVLLANMAVATFASMWISNVAAPVLCFSLIQPLLRTLPSKSPYARSLIIGIALASNIGGMASPISSPQNIIALSNMNPQPSWIQWFAVSIPVCLIGTLLVWLILLLAYKPSVNNYSTNHIRYTPEDMSFTQIYVCAVSVLTIALWCFSHQLDTYFGDMGVLAIVPIVLFFGTGVLSKDDFNNFLWTVIILAMGGIALGTGVKSSGLLAIISHGVKNLVGEYPLFQVMFIFCGFTLFVATFISHTVGAVIILPIVAEIGEALPQPHSRLLVMGSALMCSSAMGLPVSGFPNMNAIMMEDETGTRYLSVKDFLKVGVPSSIALYAVICTVGYAILSLLQF